MRTEEAPFLPEEQPSQRHAGSRPGEEHLLEQLALELRELRLELRVEPGEVELVQLPQIGPIGGVHVVEPLHELVGELVAEGILAECTLGAAAESRDLTPCPLSLRERGNEHSYLSRRPPSPHGGEGDRG